MAPRRKKRAPARRREVDFAALSGRIVELEHRIRLMEARIRQVSAASKAAVDAVATGKKPRQIRAEKPKPRCMGCLLELPKNFRRRETCVWCGFYLSAVKAQAWL